MTATRDPGPWEDVPPALGRALDAARRVAPTEADLAKIAAGLPLSPGPGGGNGDPGAQPPAPRLPVSTAQQIGGHAGLQGLLGGALLGLVVGGSWLAWGDKPAPPTAKIAAAVAPATAPAAPTAAPTAVVSGERAASSAAVLPPRATGTGESGESDLAMIERARGLARSDPSGALALLQAHAARFPKSPFGQEREVIAITALVTSGRRGEAEARAERFFAAHPGSAHLRRIDALLGTQGQREKKEEGDQKIESPSPPTP